MCINYEPGLGLQWQAVIFSPPPQVRHVQPAAVSIRDGGKGDEHIRCLDAFPALKNLKTSPNTIKLVGKRFRSRPIYNEIVFPFFFKTKCQTEIRDY